MKKRMLITTIVMVLVVAIALTTSSLAWFTMTATVSISEVSFGAVSYTGAQLSVAGLDRSGFGASASIGGYVEFDPSQGDPTIDALNFGTDATGWETISFDAGTFYQAATVETTAAGNQTANQKVTLASSNTAVFIGGFNVRNDGTGSNAAVKVNAELKVGTAHLVNPEGDGNTADDYYVYGDYDGETVGITWVGASGWYTSSLLPAATAAAFEANQKDLALAGGIRVAVYQTSWTATYDDVEEEFDYVSGEDTVREGIYAFTNYDVTWGATGWVATTGAGTNNQLYVTTPVLASVYSMNEVLADENCYVATGEACVSYVGRTSSEPVETDFLARADNTLPEVTFNLTKLTAGTYSGVEVIVVVWMDGWDDESVPAAGDGRVSLAYTVTDAA